ncbi:MAG: hypothetical protein D6775_13515 [Caldilineae bacterium]|nr:MAG: hypothetical protein D6775_13515 [Caldilineae bacterium]
MTTGVGVSVGVGKGVGEGVGDTGRGVLWRGGGTGVACNVMHAVSSNNASAAAITPNTRNHRA